MNINKNVLQKKNDNFLKQLFQYPFDGECKFIIDQSGTIYHQSAHHLNFNLKEGDHLLDFINTDQNYLSVDVLGKLINASASKSFQFSIKKPVFTAFKVLLNPLNIEEQDFLYVQFFDITEKVSLENQLNGRTETINEELTMRTQEINMTHELVNQHGEYLEKFLRGLRHDLLSPIMQLEQIITYFQNTTDEAKRRKSRALIDLNLKKISHTANGFSEFVDLHFKYQANFETNDLLKAFDNARHLFAEEIQWIGVEFKLDFGKAPDIYFSRKHLDSIFLNLLSNSLKFRSDRPLLIEVSSFLNEKEEVVLTFQDNGEGFDTVKFKEQLFYPFRKINTTHVGAGVGLSIIKSVMVRNGGDIEVEAQLDQGCKVVVTFPAIQRKKR